jgi:hypothetical protein
MEIEKRNYNEKDAAVLLGLSVKTLQLWRHLCKGPAYNKLGRRVFYFGGDLHDYIGKNRVEVK